MPLHGQTFTSGRQIGTWHLGQFGNKTTLGLPQQLLLPLHPQRPQLFLLRISCLDPLPWGWAGQIVTSRPEFVEPAIPWFTGAHGESHAEPASSVEIYGLITPVRGLSLSAVRLAERRHSALSAAGPRWCSLEGWARALRGRSKSGQGSLELGGASWELGRLFGVEVVNAVKGCSQGLCHSGLLVREEPL